MNRPVLFGFAAVVVLCAAVALLDPAYVRAATGIVIGAVAQIVATMFFVVMEDKKEKPQ